MSLKENSYKELLLRALEEDIGMGDITTEATIAPNIMGVFQMVARQPLVACGLPIAQSAFKHVSKKARVTLHVSEGQKVKKGGLLLTVHGPAGPILTAERTALNFVQHLSAIATHTARFVEEVKGTKAIILDTRKTTPGLRLLEKYAVRIGGGQNYRMRLDDGVLIKDNHISAAGGVAAAVRAAQRKIKPAMLVEVECDTVAQAKEAFKAGADRLLLDNMTLAELKEVVALNKKQNRTLEASGGVTLANVRTIAKTGVDFISTGALTHSAPQVDIGLDSVMEP
jgi:nicotinate-nucleotide pyrophosphorylase (carboxylating)